jgi:hypothetical protein
MTTVTAGSNVIKLSDRREPQKPVPILVLMDRAIAAAKLAKMELPYGA